MFVACLAEQDDAIAIAPLQQLSSLVCGSSELLRHTLHCDSTRNMKEMYKYACTPDTFKDKIKSLKRNLQIITDNKFNDIMEALKANTP